MSDRISTRTKPRSRVSLAIVVSVALWGGAVASAHAALPPLDRAAVIAAMPGVVAAGSPAYLFHALDETGEWSAAVGVADIKKDTPASADAAFRIGSISKMFVSVTILKLVEAGKIGLDDPVDRYLPGLLTRGADITIRELLQHRTGLRYVPFGTGQGNTWYPAVNAACRDDVDPITEVKLADVQLSEPGTTFEYSNANYTALGLVIDAVTGKPYEAVIEDLVLQPLGLADTSFQEGTPVWPVPYVRGYGNFQPGAIWHKNLTDETDCKMSIFGAAGSGISTTHDLVSFMTALTHGQLLPDDLYQQMIDTLPAPEFGPDFEYGLGIMRFTASCGTVILGHDGAVWGYQSQLWTTDDATRTSAEAIPIYPGTLAEWRAVGTVNQLEYCGGE